MNKAEIKQWLDKLIEVNEELAKFKDFNDEITFCNPARKGMLHIYSGILQIAEVIGSEIKCKELNDDVYKYELQCEYKDYTLYQMQKDLNEVK